MIIIMAFIILFISGKVVSNLMLSEPINLWNNFSHYLPQSSTLAVILASFLAFLLPIVIAILQSVDEDAWDGAIIATKVVNFKKLSLSVMLMILPFFLLEIKSIKIVLYLIFTVGVVMLLQIMIRCIKWLSDWSGKQGGYRNTQRKEILIANNLSSEEICKEWERFAKLASIQKKFFYMDYDELNKYIRAAYELLSDKNDNIEYRFNYIQSVSNLLSNYPSVSPFFQNGLMTYLFEEYRKAQRIQTQYKVADAIESTMKKAMKQTLNEELDRYVAANWLSDMLKGLFKNNGSKREIRFLINMLLDLFWSNDTIDDEILEHFQISITYNEIVSGSLNGQIQNELADQFFLRMSRVEKTTFNAKNAKNDILVTVLFSFADPITLGALFTINEGIRSNLVTLDLLDGHDHDYIEFMKATMGPARKFGYTSRVDVNFNNADKQSLLNENNTQRIESVKIASIFFKALKKDVVEDICKIEKVSKNNKELQQMVNQNKNYFAALRELLKYFNSLE